jgi:hypothetical protein
MQLFIVAFRSQTTRKPTTASTISSSYCTVTVSARCLLAALSAPARWLSLPEMVTGRKDFEIKMTRM